MRIWLPVCFCSLVLGIAVVVLPVRATAPPVEDVIAIVVVVVVGSVA